MAKEIKINGKIYIEFESADSMAFCPPRGAFLWMTDEDRFNLTLTPSLLVAKFSDTGDKECVYVDSNGKTYKHCALLSSLVPSESRRCTNLELQRWLSQGKGFWINDVGRTFTTLTSSYANRDEACSSNVTQICWWNNNPQCQLLEPTAKNLNLEE